MRSHLLIDLPVFGAAVAVAPTVGGAAYAAAAAAFVGVNVFATWHPRAQLHCETFRRLSPDAPGVALTFDDGPHPRATPRILDLLAAHDMRATFFVVGENVRRHPELVRRMRAEGHAIGLHSDRHSYIYPLHTSAWVVRDLRRCRDAIEDACGATTKMFRPPMGLRNPMIAAAVRDLDLATILWTAGGRDRGDGTGTRVAARLARRAEPGAILMLHDGTEPGKEASGRTGLAALEPLLAALLHKKLQSHALDFVDGALTTLSPATSPALHAA